ncbi:MAG: poly(hydroxyalkanoate) depolymerase family esterase [Granulosicoccus sp.]
MNRSNDPPHENAVSTRKRIPAAVQRGGIRHTLSSQSTRPRSVADKIDTLESQEDELSSDPMLAVFDNTIRQRLVQPPTGMGAGTVLDAEILDNSRKPWSRNKRFRVYLPANYDPNKPASMIMLLHGCQQTEEDIASISAMDLIADREHCIVVYPYVTSYLGIRTLNCWGWWQARHRRRGSGEVADLHRIATYVAQSYNIDPGRWHICGLSSGAAMTVASLVAYSDIWTSGASVAGIAYGENARAVRLAKNVPIKHKAMRELVSHMSRNLASSPAPPLLIVQSIEDRTVGPKCASDLRDAWIKSQDIIPSRETRAHDDKPYADQWPSTHQWDMSLYRRSDGGCALATFWLHQGTHGWYGGRQGAYSVTDAPNTAELIWWFFDQTADSESHNNPT